MGDGDYRLGVMDVEVRDGRAAFAGTSIAARSRWRTPSAAPSPTSASPSRTPPAPPPSPRHAPSASTPASAPRTRQGRRPGRPGRRPPRHPRHETGRDRPACPNSRRQLIASRRPTRESWNRGTFTGMAGHADRGSRRAAPLRHRDAAVWRELRVRNADWLRPWEPTNPETPLFRSGLGPYLSMVHTMRREARQGLALPWSSSPTRTTSPVSSPSARSSGVPPAPRRSATGSTNGSPDAASFPPPSRSPSTTVSSPSACTGSKPISVRRTPRAAASSKARIPGRGNSPPPPAHRRRLARPHLLRPHRRGRARWPARTLARRPQTGISPPDMSTVTFLRKNPAIEKARQTESNGEIDLATHRPYARQPLTPLVPCGA